MTSISIGDQGCPRNPFVRCEYTHTLGPVRCDKEPFAEVAMAAGQRFGPMLCLMPLAAALVILGGCEQTPPPVVPGTAADAARVFGALRNSSMKEYAEAVKGFKISVEEAYAIAEKHKEAAGAWGLSPHPRYVIFGNYVFLGKTKIEGPVERGIMVNGMTGEVTPFKSRDDAN